MITEICQMIKAIRANDTTKAMAYAGLLAENLEKDGKIKEAARVRRAINGDQGEQCNQAVMDSILVVRSSSLWIILKKTENGK